jgi:hypothetical protein
MSEFQAILQEATKEMIAVGSPFLRPVAFSPAENTSQALLYLIWKALRGGDVSSPIDGGESLTADEIRQAIETAVNHTLNLPLFTADNFDWKRSTAEDRDMYGRGIVIPGECYFYGLAHQSVVESTTASCYIHLFDQESWPPEGTPKRTICLIGKGSLMSNGAEWTQYARGAGVKFNQGIVAALSLMHRRVELVPKVEKWLRLHYSGSEKFLVMESEL